MKLKMKMGRGWRYSFHRTLKLEWFTNSVKVTHKIKPMAIDLERICTGQGILQRDFRICLTSKLQMTRFFQMSVKNRERNTQRVSSQCLSHGVKRATWSLKTKHGGMLIYAKKRVFTTIKRLDKH